MLKVGNSAVHRCQWMILVESGLNCERLADERSIVSAVALFPKSVCAAASIIRELILWHLYIVREIWKLDFDKDVRHCRTCAMGVRAGSGSGNVSDRRSVSSKEVLSRSLTESLSSLQERCGHKLGKVEKRY